MATTEFFLKTKDGRFVTVLNDMSVALCAVEIQNGRQNGPRVRIQKNYEPQNTRMAFLFLSEDGYYSPMVEGDQLKFKKDKEDTCTKPDCYWFEKQNPGSGDHYRLRSVVEPKLYVCGPNPDDSFFLSENDTQSVLVKDEKI